VAAADAAAKEAQELVTELEQKVINGDESVTPDQIVAQESLGRFARLRAAATRRKADAAKEAARLRDCQILHDEIAAYATGDGERLATLYQAIFDAREAFRTVMEERSEFVLSWYRRAEALGVAKDDGRPMPKEKDGRIALARNSTGVKTDTAVFKFESSEVYLGTHERPALFDEDGVAAVCASLRKIDEPTLRPIPEYIYRGPNGAILERDHPFTDEEIARTGVRRIVAAEAWPE